MVTQPALSDAIQNRRSWRRIATSLLWTALFLGLLFAFFSHERPEFTRLIYLVRRAQTSWLLGAVALEGVILLAMALVYQSVLARLRHHIPLRLLLTLVLQRQAIATVVPAGGAAGSALLVRELQKRAVPVADAVMAAALFSVLGHVSFALVLTPVLVMLGMEGRVPGIAWLGAALLGMLVIALAGMLWILLRPGDPPPWLERRLPERLRHGVAALRQHELRPAELAAALGWSLLVDVLGAVMLFACLRAIGVPATATIAAGGYAVGTLFLMLAPVFQGIGIVELSMTVALQRLGVHPAAALGATLLYRLCEVWLPLVLGLAAQPAIARPDRWFLVRWPALVTALTGGLAVLSVISPAIPRRFNRIEQYWPLSLHDLSRTLTLLIGFSLLLLSFSLWRRKRVAWVMATSILAALFAASLTHPHQGLVAAFAAVNLGVLLIHHRRFRVRSDIPTVRRGLAQLVASVLLALGYGTLGFWLLDRREFGVNFSLGDALGRTLRLYFGWSSAGLVPHTRYADWFLDSFPILGALTLGYALWAIARPVVWRHRTLPAERARARALIERYGRSSLDFFKYWPDKHFFFASNGQAVIAFREFGGAAVALGDPAAADEASFKAAVTEFLDFCDANGWSPAFHQVPPEHLDAYRAAGLSALKIGEDAIVELASFRLQGGAMKSLRGAVNRFEREGNTIEMLDPPLPDSVLIELRAVSDEWLSLEGRRERGFTLGQWDDDYIRQCRVIVARDARGAIQAFANIIPDGVPGEATVDLMRHRRTAPRGVMDVLFVRLMEHLRDEGFSAFSLGMAPLAAVGTSPDAPVKERVLRLLFEHANRWFSYRGLYAYKAKFQPRWEPRYLVYGSEMSLAKIAFAIVRLTEQPGYRGIEAPRQRRRAGWQTVREAVSAVPRRILARNPQPRL
jgi:phosphatidylglycerol lysyltransferase